MPLSRPQPRQNARASERQAEARRRKPKRMSDHYLCVRGNRAHNLRWNWVYVRRGDDLVRYGKTVVSSQSCADYLLALPKTWRSFDSTTGEGCECAECRGKRVKA